VFLYPRKFKFVFLLHIKMVFIFPSGAAKSTQIQLGLKHFLFKKCSAIFIKGHIFLRRKPA